MMRKYIILFSIVSLLVIPLIPLHAINTGSDDEWVEVKIRNPNFDESLIADGWVPWSSPKGNYDYDDYWVLFIKWEVEIKEVQAIGYKNDDYESFVVSYIQFLANRHRSWSGTNKRWICNFGFGITVGWPDDFEAWEPCAQPNQDSWTSYSNSWGIFYDYSSYYQYKLQSQIGFQKKQSGLWITKALATSSVLFWMN